MPPRKRIHFSSQFSSVQPRTFHVVPFRLALPFQLQRAHKQRAEEKAEIRSVILKLQTELLRERDNFPELTTFPLLTLPRTNTNTHNPSPSNRNFLWSGAWGWFVDTTPGGPYPRYSGVFLPYSHHPGKYERSVM